MLIPPDTHFETGFSSLTPPGLQGRKFGRRAVAYLIDGLVIGALNLSVGFALGLLIGVVGVFTYALFGSDLVFGEADTTVVDALAGVVLTVSYFTLFGWLTSASPGK